MRRWLLLLWILLIGEAIFIAPPELPSTWGMVWRMLTFDWVGISPTIIALFYAVGVVLAMHASFLLTEGRKTKPHPLFALIPAIALGAFVMLPYYALRLHGPPHEPRRSWLASPILRTALIAALITCVLYGVLAGNLDMFWYEVTTRKFSHVMALDFLILLGLLPAVPRL